MADTCGERVESNCPFCNINQFDERLIAEVDGFYIIATLGQITDGGYVLLVPKDHITCMGALTKEQNLKASKISKEICQILTCEYNQAQALYWSSVYPITLFEHGIVGQTVKHAHLHFIPTVLDLTLKIQMDFRPLGSRIEQLKYVGHLQNSYRDEPMPYLYWVTGKENDTTERVCWNPPAPAQYLRIITAEALGRPERANWRTMDPELDKRLWSDTVRRLKPYFS